MVAVQVLLQQFTCMLTLRLRARECFQRRAIGKVVKKFQRRQAYQEEDQ